MPPSFGVSLSGGAVLHSTPVLAINIWPPLASGWGNVPCKPESPDRRGVKREDGQGKYA